METKKAVVLFSGGLDSTTTLYHAIRHGYEPHTITFDYSQRHSIELKRAAEIINKIKIKNHIVVKLDPAVVSSSALTSNIEVPKNRKTIEENIIPVTYVPARNLIFLSIAVGYAESHGINDIFIGVNAIDFSGYPDCRPDFIESFEKTARLGTKEGRESRGLTIHTPLISKTKVEIVAMAKELKAPIELTWSCYDPQVETSGVTAPCGVCDSCIIRNNALEKYDKSE